MPRSYLILGLASALVFVSPGAAVESAPRTTPSRPSAAPVKSTTSNVDGKLIPISDVASKLGLKVTWLVPGVRAVLSDAHRRLELEADSRETLLGGLRVFLGSPVIARRGQLSLSAIDVDACLIPLLQPSLLSRPLPRPKMIAIDAGHGGVDQGTENQRLSLREKTFTLDVALRLKALLDQKGYVTVLTRSSDVTVDKPMRVVIATRAHADLFVSIHFNALPNDRKTRGTEIFTFAPRFQRSTNSWSPLEPDDTERDASPGNDFDAWNSLLAQAVHREVLSGLKTMDRGKKIAHLGVLRGLSCPGVLVESGFLSNDEEARQIATPAFRQQIASAIAAGIQSYSNELDSLRVKP